MADLLRHSTPPRVHRLISVKPSRQPDRTHCAIRSKSRPPASIFRAARVIGFRVSSLRCRQSLQLARVRPGKHNNVPRLRQFVHVDSLRKGASTRRCHIVDCMQYDAALTPRSRVRSHVRCRAIVLQNNLLVGYSLPCHHNPMTVPLSIVTGERAARCNTRCEASAIHISSPVDLFRIASSLSPAGQTTGRKSG